jgi:predicted ATPase
MKAGILLAVLLAVAGVATAEEVKQNTVNQHQLSKRPYAAPVVDKETFDGAVVDKEQVEKPKQLNLHMLGRRPYSEKAAD